MPVNKRRWSIYDAVPAEIRALVTKITYGSADPMQMVIKLREIADRLEKRILTERNTKDQTSMFDDSTSNITQ